MYCIKCGAQLHEGARFCANCGAVVAKTGASPTKPIEEAPKADVPKVEMPTVEALKEEAPKTEASEANSEQVDASAYAASVTSEASQSKPEKPQKKKGKGGKIIAIVAVIVAAVILLGAIATAACYFLLFHSGLNRELPTYAYVDHDGTGYLCYSDGRFLEIGDDIISACLTPDEKKILVAQTDGRVYWTDLKMSEETEITDLKLNRDAACSVHFTAVTNDFAIITFVDRRTSQVNKTTNYRYSFERDELVELSVDTVDLKKPNMSVIKNATVGYSEFVNEISYVKAEKGKISVLRSDSDEFKHIAFYDYGVQISFCGISTDGNTVCWVEFKDGKYNVMLHTNDETKSIASGTYSKNVLPTFTMTADPNNEVFVILGSNTAVFIRYGEIETVNFSGTVNATAEICTTNGLSLREDEKAARAFGFYVAVAEITNGSYNVYAIEFDGADKIRLAEGVYAWMVAEDKLVYLDAASTLYIAEVDLDEQELTNTNKVAMNVFNVALSETSADKIYYLKNYDFNTAVGELYVYDVENDDDTKIDNNVSGYIQVSEDARYVYYFTNVTNDNLGTVIYGDLNVYDSKQDDSEEINDDVIINSVWSALSSGEYDPNSIWYQQYQGSWGTGYKYDVCYYNGKSSSTVVDGAFFQ